MHRLVIALLVGLAFASSAKSQITVAPAPFRVKTILVTVSNQWCVDQHGGTAGGYSDTFAYIYDLNRLDCNAINWYGDLSISANGPGSAILIDFTGGAYSSNVYYQDYSFEVLIEYELDMPKIPNDVMTRLVLRSTLTDASNALPFGSATTSIFSGGIPGNPILDNFGLTTGVADILLDPILVDVGSALMLPLPGGEVVQLASKTVVSFKVPPTSTAPPQEIIPHQTIFDSTVTNEVFYVPEPSATLELPAGAVLLSSLARMKRR